jgi:hypothetical protein
MERTIGNPAKELRDLEAARLDRLQEQPWLQAVQGNLAAIDRCLRIMERRAKLLGLDEVDPNRVNLVIINQAVNEVIDAVLAVSKTYIPNDRYEDFARALQRYTDPTCSSD